MKCQCQVNFNCNRTASKFQILVQPGEDDIIAAYCSYHSFDKSIPGLTEMTKEEFICIQVLRA